MESGRVPSRDPFVPTEEARRRSLLCGIERLPVSRKNESDSNKKTKWTKLIQRFDAKVVSYRAGTPGRDRIRD